MPEPLSLPSPYPPSQGGKSESNGLHYAYTTEPQWDPLHAYWNVLVQRWHLVLLVFLLVISVTAYVTFSATPLYTALTTLRIEPQNPTVMQIEEVSSPEAAGGNYHQTQVVLLGSRGLAAKIITDLGQRKGIPVYFDSAQGLGATYRDTRAGSFGVCEVFSLSPTKVITAVEGGIITTNDTMLADRLRAMRDYGKDPDNGEVMIFLGLSARMSELHAAVGLLSLRNIENLVHARLRHITHYRERLGSLPGCWVQTYPADRTSSGNYFVVFITDRARRSRDEVYQALKAVGIQTKRYFYPPVHTQTIFQHFPARVSAKLTQTLKASHGGLALPLYSHMTDEQHEVVCQQVEQLLA